MSYCILLSFKACGVSPQTGLSLCFYTREVGETDSEELETAALHIAVYESFATKHLWDNWRETKHQIKLSIARLGKDQDIFCYFVAEKTEIKL